MFKKLILAAVALLLMSAPAAAQAWCAGNVAPWPGGVWDPETCNYLKPNSDGSINVVGTFAGTTDMNVEQVGGTATATNNGGANAGTIRVTVANDSTGIIGVTNLPTTVATDNGAATASTPRVTIANNSTGTLAVTNAGTFATQSAATQSGTWTVQPGNTANTTPWLVTETPATSGGLTAVASSTLGPAAAAVKNNPGQVYAWNVYNPNAAVCYVNVYNVVAASVTVGTTPATWWIQAPANGGQTLSVPTGILHDTGISVSATTTPTGNTDCGSDLVISMFYK